jgi:hypothetical protein
MVATSKAGGEEGAVGWASASGVVRAAVRRRRGLVNGDLVVEVRLYAGLSALEFSYFASYLGLRPRLVCVAPLALGASLLLFALCMLG